MKLNVLTQSFFDLLFPHYCVGCSVSNALVCDNCRGNITFAQQICFVCRTLSDTGRTHFECLRSIGLSYYPTQVLSACSYQNTLVKDLIHGLKYDGIRDASKACSDILIKFLLKEKVSFSDKWVVTFVPLDQKKMESRGFNQSELVAKELATKLDLPCENLLQKIKVTKSQMKLSRAERLINVKSAFIAPKVVDQKVVIVDDVVTTGSTLLECSKALHLAGAYEVVWLTLARD